MITLPASAAMTAVPDRSGNWSLKEEIRDYWSKRAATFDLSFGHRIPPGPEREAWTAVIRRHLGPGSLNVLELASGTGEVTGVLLDLGHRVTGIDFSDAMVERSRMKHHGNERARFILGDAENTMEPDGSYDAVVCRHLVWTLTDPHAALSDWHRVLKAGGRLLVFDGDFVNLSRQGRLARRAMTLIERWTGPDSRRDAALAARHAEILRALPFSDGLAFGHLRDLAEAAGFSEVGDGGYGPIARAQRRIARNPQDWLRTWLYTRFVLHARKRAADRRGVASLR